MIFLYGAYGCDNHGDDLICKGALIKYSKSKIFAFFNQPNISLPENNEVYITNENYKKVIDILTSSIKDIKKFIFAGGGLFWNVEHIQSMYNISKFCHDNKIPVHFERVGLHGAQYSPKLSIEMLEMASYISVRDRSSKHLIEGMGLNTNEYIFIEPCFTSFLPKLLKDKKSNFCFINLTLWLKHDFDRTSNMINKIITKYNNIPFVYFIQTKHHNRQHGEEISVNKLKNIVKNNITILNEISSEKYYDNFSKAKFVISSGYHTALLPTLNNIPVFQLCQGVDNQTKYLAVAKENPSIEYYVQSVYQTMNIEKIFSAICKFIEKNM